jgi:hypothetical protein
MENRRANLYSEWQWPFCEMHLVVVQTFLAKKCFQSGSYSAQDDLRVSPVSTALVLIVQTPILEKESD